MRLRVLSIGVPLLVLGVGSPVVTQARDNARFEGVGTGITHTPSDQPSGFLSATETAGRDRPARAGANADRAGQAPAAARRGPGGFDYRGLRMTPAGLDPVARDGMLGRSASGGVTLLPPDLRGMPQPPGSPPSDRPSPMISVRENGGVLGLSYKIKPTQQ